MPRRGRRIQCGSGPRSLNSMSDHSRGAITRIAVMALTAALLLLHPAAILCQQTERKPAEKKVDQKPAPEKQAEKTQATPPPSGPATYVGMSTCEGCHEEIVAAFNKSAHAAIGVAARTKKWKEQACESCHGPGSIHAESMSVDDIRNPSKLSGYRADEACLECHSQKDMHVSWIGSSHEKNNVSCVSCHSVHKGAEALRPRRFASENELCASCHASTRASFHQPYGHRIDQNAMACVDCHNPHGSILKAAINTTFANDEVCLKCHSNIRGPFVYQHAPVKLDGCTSCHVPHGSANPKMLTRHEVRFVCLECHANIPSTFTGIPTKTLGSIPPSFHDINQPQFQNCTVCHVKIHGSNLDRNLQR
jgi:DmsE family decaheme c-type cytochrome